MRLSKTTNATGYLEEYCIVVLMEMQFYSCTICGEFLDKYQLHHKRYGEDITINDLELIHGQCHSKEHGRNGTRGVERTLFLEDKQARKPKDLNMCKKKGCRKRLSGRKKSWCSRKHLDAGKWERNKLKMRGG